MYAIVSSHRTYTEVLFRRRSYRRGRPRVLLYYTRIIIHFVLRSWYIILLLCTARERNDTMSPDVYSLISMSLCRDGEDDETEGNTPVADQPSARVCVRQIYYPLYFMCFGFTFVREGWAHVRSGGGGGVRWRSGGVAQSPGDYFNEGFTGISRPKN